MQTHPTRSRLPLRPGVVLAQPGQLEPCRTAVFRFEERGIFHPGVDMIGIAERRFEVPDAFEFPRMLRAVVPLMRARDAVVNELVALAHRHPLWICCRPAAWRIPCFAAVIRALNDLSEPSARL